MAGSNCRLVQDELKQLHMHDSDNVVNQSSQRKTVLVNEDADNKLA